MRQRVSNRDPADADSAWDEEPTPDAPQEDEPFASDEQQDRNPTLAQQPETAETIPPFDWDEVAAKLRPVPWRVVLPAALAALALVALGIGVLALNGRPGHPTSVRIAGTATPAQTATSTSTPNTTPTADQLALPDAVIRFGVGGSWTNDQQCNGTAPLDPLTFSLYNSGTVPVDWYASITDPTPDGKLPWAVAGAPYGTLPAGQSATLTITPDPSLCGQLAKAAAKAAAPVTYHVTIFYAGIGGASITDTITPPTPTPGHPGP